jgi:hypothetical protein
MKYKTFPSFWKTYESLDNEVKKQAKKVFELWREGEGFSHDYYSRIQICRLYP